MKKAFALAFTLLASPALAWPEPCCTDVEWAAYRNIPSHIKDMSDSAWFTEEYQKWAKTLPEGNVRAAYLKWIQYFLDERAKFKLDTAHNDAIKTLADQIPVGACTTGMSPAGNLPRTSIVKCQTMRQ